MAQTFTLRGINIGVRKSFANAAKVFRKVFQRLSLILRKSLEWQMLHHRASYIIPYSIMYYTFEHRTINHIARKFIADKGDKIISRGSFIYIGREFNFHHEGISTASGWRNIRQWQCFFHTRVSVSQRYIAVVFTPGCGGVDGIPWIFPYYLLV